MPLFQDCKSLYSVPPDCKSGGAGSAVAVEVVGEGLGQRVVGEDAVGLVHGLQLSQLLLSMLMASATAGDEEQQYNEECVFHSEKPSCTPKGGDVFRGVLHL